MGDRRDVQHRRSRVSVFGTSAIVVGTQTIRLSDDTGETWRTPTGVVPSQTFVSVSHHTASIATASAIGGSRYRTIDGGETWTEVGVGEIPGTADHVAFFAEKLGTAAMGNPARVFFTDDRGDTWEEVANFGQGRITAIDVVGPEKAYAILGTGQIHVTENSGKTWAFATSVPPEDGIINGLDASDPNIWYAVGGVGFLAETRNGGNTWQHTSEGRIGTFKSVAFADANIGVAAFTPRLNFAEVALRTTDGGQTWIAVDPQMARPDRVVFSKSAQVGILIGSRFVSKSVNQGFTWENVSPPATDGLLGGAILDELTYIVCGHNSGLFRTTDGGGSWTDVSPSSGDRFEDVRFFPDRVTGLLVGPDASYRTLDGGVTWEVVNVRAVAVACIGNDVAVAIGNQILRSVDRGQNWTIVTTPAATMMTIAFADELQGFVAGVGGNVFETLDGGLSWALAPKETSVRLRSATFRDGRAAVAVGDGGAVLLGTP